jgi:hypothetical protein
MGLLGMGIIIAPLYAFLLTRENRKRDAWQAHQDTLPAEQRTKFTIQELHEAGDNAKGRLLQQTSFANFANIFVQNSGWLASIHL